MAYRATERTEARRLEARAALLRAARGLLADDGFRAASVSAVASRAGVATGSVYRHFPTKADLLAEVFRDASGHEVRATFATGPTGAPPDAGPTTGDPTGTEPPGTTAADRTAAAVATFARRALAGRRLAWALLAEPVDPVVEAERLVHRRAYVDGFRAILDDGVASGELPGQPTEVAAAVVVGGLAEALVGPASPLHPLAPDDGRSVDADALVADLVTVALRTVGAAPPAHDAGRPSAAASDAVAPGTTAPRRPPGVPAPPLPQEPVR